MNREEFQKKLAELGKFAEEKGGSISDMEVKHFLEEYKLSEEQYQLVFAYLAARQVAVEGYAAPKEEEEKEEIPLLPEEEHFLNNYKQALGNLLIFKKDLVLEMCKKVEDTRDDMAKNRLIELMLSEVLRLADEFRGRGMLLGDLVQEGNIGLMLALETLGLRPEGMSALEYLRREIRAAISQAIEDDLNEKLENDALAGKLNDLSDSIQKLSEDFGDQVSIEELSAFTDMSVEEIEELLKLAGESAGEEPEKEQK